MTWDRFTVAGGAGFIGSHVVERILETDARQVLVIDNFSTGSMKNLYAVQHDPRLRILRADVTGDLDSVPSADVVIHLASPANPLDYVRLRYETLTANSRGTERLARLAVESDARFIYFSSSEIYGNHPILPHGGLGEGAESRTVLAHPRSAYFVGKMFGEELVRALGESLGLDYLIVRPFNVYGPRMDVNSPYGRVMTNFLRAASRRMPLPVNGDGSQERSFCWIEDLVDCLMLLLAGPFPSERLVNVGSPEPVRIIELAHLVNSLTGNRAGIAFADRYPYEPRRRTPNIERVRAWTGWSPRTPLLQGLRELCESLQVAEAIVP